MRRIIAMFTVAVAGFAVVPQIAVGALTERVSVAPGGTQANNDSLVRRSVPTGATWPSCRTRRTWSPATRTTADDVFVRDRRSGTTQRVSVATDGTQANGDSY